MVELFNKTYANGDVVKVRYSVKSNYKDIVVTFIQENYSDNNKWGKKQVLTDLTFTRHRLLMSYCQVDPTGEKISKYIKENFKEGAFVAKKVQKFARESNSIKISLPTSKFACNRGIPTDCRMFKETFFPLIVTIDGRDESRCFMDFDVFGSDAVDMAYQSLVNDKKIKSDNDIKSFIGVKLLHKKIIKEEDDCYDVTL